MYHRVLAAKPSRSVHVSTIQIILFYLCLDHPLRHWHLLERHWLLPPLRLLLAGSRLDVWSLSGCKPRRLRSRLAHRHCFTMLHVLLPQCKTWWQAAVKGGNKSCLASVLLHTSSVCSEPNVWFYALTSSAQAKRAVIMPDHGCKVFFAKVQGRNIKSHKIWKMGEHGLNMLKWSLC